VHLSNHYITIGIQFFHAATWVLGLNLVDDFGLLFNSMVEEAFDIIY